MFFFSLAGVLSLATIVLIKKFINDTGYGKFEKVRNV